MVTISVPRNKLNPIFLFGFLTSPAMKVTLFHASLLNIEPTMAAATAPRAAAMVSDSNVPSGLSFCILHAFCQLDVHISGFMTINPKIIRPKRLNNLVRVNEV